MCLIVIIAAVGLILLLGFFSVMGFAFAFLPLLIVGLIIGALASAITESRHGVIGDIVIGLVGSVIGGILFSILFHVHPRLFTLQGLLAALIGATILLVFVKGVSSTA